MNDRKLFDANAYWTAGKNPWTFFAFPGSLADPEGLPRDDDASRLYAELQKRGIDVGVWTNSQINDTSYFACPKEHIDRLHIALQELAERGEFEQGFCEKRSEYLFSLVAKST